FTFSGEYLPLDTHFAIGNFVRNALVREPIKINSDGKSRRSYMHGSDMATWLWAATAKGSIADPIHVGSERSVSILELAHAVAEVSARVLDFRPEVIVANPDPGARNFHQYVPATRKTRALLEVEEWTSLEAGIQQMLEAAQNQH
ncbi:MAG: NAD-dependent epimerase/dehydratase family protein, partial [Actinomycetota bacterium]